MSATGRASGVEAKVRTILPFALKYREIVLPHREDCLACLACLACPDARKALIGVTPDSGAFVLVVLERNEMLRVLMFLDLATGGPATLLVDAASLRLPTRPPAADTRLAFDPPGLPDAYAVIHLERTGKQQ